MVTKQPSIDPIDPKGVQKRSLTCLQSHNGLSMQWIGYGGQENGLPLDRIDWSCSKLIEKHLIYQESFFVWLAGHFLCCCLKCAGDKICECKMNQEYPQTDKQTKADKIISIM